jgi:hypothetical protein
MNIHYYEIAIALYPLSKSYQAEVSDWQQNKLSSKDPRIKTIPALNQKISNLIK